jgi:hypothetical protein
MRVYPLYVLAGSPAFAIGYKYFARAPKCRTGGEKKRETRMRTPARSRNAKFKGASPKSEADVVMELWSLRSHYNTPTVTELKALFGHTVGTVTISEYLTFERLFKMLQKVLEEVSVFGGDTWRKLVSSDVRDLLVDANENLLHPDPILFKKMETDYDATTKKRFSGQLKQEHTGRGEGNRREPRTCWNGWDKNKLHRLKHCPFS